MRSGLELEPAGKIVEKEEELKFQDDKLINMCLGEDIHENQYYLWHDSCPHTFGIKSLLGSRRCCKYHEECKVAKQCWELSLADMRKNYRGEE